jgi:nucleoside-diphosphate-sugar epimerase
MKDNRMKIVITGALGHIGSRLIREIPSDFHEAEIIMIDDLSTQRYCSLFDLPPNGRYRFLEADILIADLNTVFASADVVVHLAAITNAPASFEIVDKVDRVNLTGTERVAQACLKVGCPMIFPSTTSVYGTQKETVDEDCPISDLKPQSPYAESKLRAEQLLQTLGETESLRFIICRFGTIFGTSIGMRFHTAVNKFCWQAVMGQPITVWRTAMHQNRPYLDLGDAVEAIKFIIQRELYDCRVYNVVTTNVPVSRILEIISTHIPKVSFQYVDSKIMNQLSYHVFNNRFKSLGFEFKGSLEQGIKETIDLFKGIRKRQAQGSRVVPRSIEKK